MPYIDDLQPYYEDATTTLEESDDNTTDDMGESDDLSSDISEITDELSEEVDNSAYEVTHTSEATITLLDREIKLDFPTWESFIDFAQRSPTSNIRRSRDTYNPTWFGCTFDEAINLALNGWPEGLQRVTAISKVIEDLLPVSQNPKLTMINSIVGPGTLDMGRYIMGHPEAYNVWTPVEQDNPEVIDIIVDFYASGAVSPEAIMHRGATIMSLIDYLEAHSKRVNLYLTERCQIGYYPTILLKKDNQFTDRERIIYALAHPSFLRRLGFSVQEVIDRTAGGYGGASMKPDIKPGDLYIEPLSAWNHSFSVLESSKWIIEVLAKYGVQTNA